MLASSFEVLDHCARAAGLEFDPVVAQKAIRRAEDLVPGGMDRTWTDRLDEAARALGLRVSGKRWTVREAIASAVPAMP